MAVRGKKSAKVDPSYRNLKADYYPVQRRIALTAQDVNPDYYTCDVGRQLSVVNHRLYRQGKTYQVKIDLDPRATGPNTKYEVYALVDTWYIQKAWQLARAVYLENTANERNVMSKQQIARWEDFRVSSGLDFGGTIVPSRSSTTLAPASDTTGEFELSQITLADGVTRRSFTWGATAGTELGILVEYDKSGSTDPSPSTSSGAKAYAGVEGDVFETSMDDLAEHGDLPPYNNTNFNTRVWMKVCALDSTPGGQKLSTGYFNAPCGLIAILPDTPSDPIQGRLTLEVKAGQYKGVAAMNMGA